MTPETDNAIRAACRRCTEEIQQAMRKSQSLTGTIRCLQSSTSITRKLKLWELASWSSSYTQGGLIAASEWNREQISKGWQRVSQKQKHLR